MIVFNNSTATTDDASFWTYKASYEKDTVATIDGTTYSYGLKLDNYNINTMLKTLTSFFDNIPVR